MKKIRVALTIAVLLFGGFMIAKSITNMMGRKKEAVQLAQERTERAERIAEARGCGKRVREENLDYLKNNECESCGIEYRDDELGQYREEVCVSRTAIIVKKFFECGFNIREENDFLLRQAAVCGDKNTVTALLKAGADVHAKNDEVLLRAIGKKNIELVELLLAAGANPRVHQNEPLLLAIALNNQPLVTRLIKAGADACDKEATQAASRNEDIAILLRGACEQKTGGKK